jgi:hypothetical protein
MSTGQSQAKAPQGRQTAHKISDCALMDDQHLFYALSSQNVISSTTAMSGSSRGVIHPQSLWKTLWTTIVTEDLSAP